MKKIIRFSAFVITLIMPLIALNTAYINTDFYRSMNEWIKYENVPKAIDICNFGSSHAMRGIAYADSKGKVGFNFSLSSQPLKYDYALLQQYQANIKDGATVILQISPWSMYLTAENTLEKAVEPVYYHLLDTKFIPGFDYKKAIIYKWLPVLGAKENVYQVFEKPVPVQAAPLAVQSVPMSEDEWNAHSIARAAEHINLTHEQVVNAECKAELQNMLLLLSAKHCKIAVVTVPYPGAYYNAFAPEFWNVFYQDIQDVIKDYPLAKMFKYADDERFADNIIFFADGDHLTGMGTNKFSQILFDDLRKEGWL